MKSETLSALFLSGAPTLVSYLTQSLCSKIFVEWNTTAILNYAAWHKSYVEIEGAVFILLRIYVSCAYYVFSLVWKKILFTGSDASYLEEKLINVSFILYCECPTFRILDISIVNSCVYEEPQLLSVRHFDEKIRSIT